MNESKTSRRALLSGAAAVGAFAGLSTLAPGVAVGAQRLPARRFEGKVVAVTGGTSGIGAATARAFALAGAKVVFCGRREQLGKDVERRIRADGGEVTYLPADVRLPEAVGAFVDGTVKRYGRLDIAFNNAGIQYSARLHETTLQQWDDLISTNARGVFLAMKAQIPVMIAQGGGQIIVNSSVGALVGRPNLSLYQASKQAIQALVKSAALEYGEQGIRVNAILPGITDTAMIRPPGLDDVTWERVKVELGKLNVDGLKTVASPEVIASAVLGIASDDFGYLTGASIPVDGGVAAGRRLLLPQL
jgi:NAD(P)-dependent dehydrogenase (short-subunit alcohol dehydrogenase family)